MSALTLTIAFLIGMIFSPLLILGIAPVISGAAKLLIKLGIRSGGDWLLKPVGGTRYELVQVEYDDAEGKAWRAGDDDDEDRDPDHCATDDADHVHNPRLGHSGTTRKVINRRLPGCERRRHG